MKKRLDKKARFRAQGLLEYALLISLLVIGVGLVLSLFGVSVSGVYCNVAKSLGSQEACAAKKVFCNDAFDAALSGWQSSQQKPSVKDGQMCFSSGTQSLNQCSVEMKKNDYTVKMDDVNLNTGNGYGVFFRATDTANGLNGYVFQYDPGLKSSQYPNGAFIIRKWVNGREIWEPIATAPMGADVYNVPHDFEVTANGDTLTVTMDGQKILTAKDDTYASGGTGIRSWDSTSACMANFSVLESKK